MVDVTTTLAEAGRIAHGTTRVERGIVGGMLACDPAGLSFCRFDRGAPALRRSLPRRTDGGPGKAAGG